MDVAGAPGLLALVAGFGRPGRTPGYGRAVPVSLGMRGGAAVSRDFSDRRSACHARRDGRSGRQPALRAHGGQREIRGWTASAPRPAGAGGEWLVIVFAGLCTFGSSLFGLGLLHAARQFPRWARPSAFPPRLVILNLPSASCDVAHWQATYPQPGHFVSSNSLENSPGYHFRRLS